MDAWIARTALVVMFLIGVAGVVATDHAKRKNPNSAYARHSTQASAGFVILAVFSAFTLFAAF